MNEILPSLTPREKEVLPLLGQGMTYKQIAVQMGVTTETVKKHLKNIYGKLNAGNKIEALRKFGSL